MSTHIGPWAICDAVVGCAQGVRGLPNKHDTISPLNNLLFPGGDKSDSVFRIWTAISMGFLFLLVEYTCFRYP